MIVDCTASAAIARHYPEWLAAGIHVVTPNKQAGSADMAFYRTLAEARRAGGSHYLYEATVGAGLPIIQTLRGLLTGTPIGHDAVLAVVWCLAIAAAGYLWARARYDRRPVVA